MTVYRAIYKKNPVWRRHPVRLCRPTWTWPSPFRDELPHWEVAFSVSRWLSSCSRGVSFWTRDPHTLFKTFTCHFSLSALPNDRRTPPVIVPTRHRKLMMSYSFQGLRCYSLASSALNSARHFRTPCAPIPRNTFDVLGHRTEPKPTSITSMGQVNEVKKGLVIAADGSIVKPQEK